MPGIQLEKTVVEEKTIVEVKDWDLPVIRHALPTVDEVTEASTEDLPGLVRMYPPEFADWSEAEIRKLVRKQDILIMPLLMAGMFMFRLGQGNIGNAATDFFREEVGITQLQFNVGVSVSGIATALAEIPSNIVMYRVGPALWIGGQYFFWSIISMLQAFQKGGPGGFIALRFFLGALEAGYTPAGLYIMTRWYKDNELTKRFALFFAAAFAENIVGGPVAYGLLQLRGRNNMSGWQWLFIVEGCLGLLLSLIYSLFLPRSTNNPTAYLLRGYFTDREKDIIARRLLVEETEGGHEKESKHVTRAEFRRVLTNWRLVPITLTLILGVTPTAALAIYGPQLTISFGFPRLESNAMESVGGALGTILALLSGYIADKTGRRGIITMVCMFFFFVTMLVNRLLIYSGNSIARFIFKSLSSGLYVPMVPVVAAWLVTNCDSPGERTILMACIAMLIQIAGTAGVYLLTDADKPYYPRAWTAMACLTAASFAFSVVAVVMFSILNRKRKLAGERLYKF